MHGKSFQNLQFFNFFRRSNIPSRKTYRNRFLARLSLRSGLNVFHHFIQVGGTVYSNEKNSGFILGLNKITSAITTPDTDILFRTPDAQAYKVAKLEDILNCVSIEDIKNLKDNKSESYRARNFIPIPPFLMHPIHSAISVYQGNAERILLDVISSVKLFDSLHDSDNEYKEKAVVKCKPLLL